MAILRRPHSLDLVRAPLAVAGGWEGGRQRLLAGGVQRGQSPICKMTSQARLDKDRRSFFRFKGDISFGNCSNRFLRAKSAFLLQGGFYIRGPRSLSRTMVVFLIEGPDR
jgi:hypothetical protein